MKPIEEITISGFRGIRDPLTFKLSRGSHTYSMVIYGRNGTGKSSITDAWEWFHSQRIEHLAREGARERSYPHRNAKQSETYVQVRFSDSALGNIRLEYDRDRVTIPKIVGDIDSFRNLAPHPCQIRFEDLTRFVYLTKADKYDALAQLMGFVPQVDLQKALKRVLRKLDEELESRIQAQQSQTENLQQSLAITRVTEKEVLAKLNMLFDNHGIGKAETVQSSEERYRELTKIVQKDPRSAELSGLQRAKQVLDDTQMPKELAIKVESHYKSMRVFKQEEEQSVDLLLLDLYESGQNTLNKLRELEQESEDCPLCGQRFEGDLAEHIAQHLHRLRELRKARDAHEKERKQIADSLDPYENLAEDLRKGLREAQKTIAAVSTKTLINSAENLQEAIRAVNRFLGIRVEELKKVDLNKMQVSSETLRKQHGQFEKARRALVLQAKDRTRVLEDDTTRKSLVEDYASIRTILVAWKLLGKARARHDRLYLVHSKFNAVVADYIRTSANDVQQRFEAISRDVQNYFGTLEVHNSNLGQPTLKLLTDQDRAVELEVEFLGEPIFPAYRYLSESQLNSFGLAIFLASAKYFNKRFKFLILDDVINSFDGYKRPEVITLLKREFPDHQVVLLTHDSVWRDRLITEFPRWTRYRFRRWEPEIGPVVDELLLPLEVVEQLIDDDEPSRAGRNLGPLLERELQYLAENFEVEMKYNRRNEYTLGPLMERFRVRVGRKLGLTHPLYLDVVSLEQEAGFRNLSAHWKNPAINITPEEMQAVVKIWKDVVKRVRCPVASCHSYIKYDGMRAFFCPCGSMKLEKVMHDTSG